MSSSQMIAAKSRVSQYFSARKAEPKLLNDNQLASDSDFLEVYVLVLLAEATGGTPQQLDTGVTPHVFRIAGSPSPSWEKASYIDLGGIAARTGFQVHCGDSRAELDVILIKSSDIPQPEQEVPSAHALAALECKAHAGKLQLPDVDSILGKALRVWGQVPLATIGAGASHAKRFSAVSLSGSAPSVSATLNNKGIGLANDIGPELDAILVQLREALTAAGLLNAP